MTPLQFGLLAFGFLLGVLLYRRGVLLDRDEGIAARLQALTRLQTDADALRWSAGYLIETKGADAASVLSYVVARCPERDLPPGDYEVHLAVFIVPVRKS